VQTDFIEEAEDQLREMEAAQSIEATAARAGAMMRVRLDLKRARRSAMRSTH
jgi:hypothetical protein